MTGFRYVGAGEHLEGVPARDLVDDEFADLSEDKQVDVRACRLYEEQKSPPATVAVSKANTPAPAAPAEGES